MAFQILIDATKLSSSIIRIPAELLGNLLFPRVESEAGMNMRGTSRSEKDGEMSFSLRSSKWQDEKENRPLAK